MWEKRTYEGYSFFNKRLYDLIDVLRQRRPENCPKRDLKKNIQGVRSKVMKDAYKNDRSFAVFRLHFFQEYFYIPGLRLIFLRFWALYRMTSVSRRQRRSNGVNMWVLRKRFEPRLHLGQRGIFVGVRTYNEYGIPLIEKSFVGRSNRSISTYAKVTFMAQTHWEAPRIVDARGESYGVYQTVSDEGLK
jgi:hypothetical protein